MQLARATKENSTIITLDLVNWDQLREYATLSVWRRHILWFSFGNFMLASKSDSGDLIGDFFSLNSLATILREKTTRLQNLLPKSSRSECSSTYFDFSNKNRHQKNLIFFIYIE